VSAPGGGAARPRRYAGAVHLRRPTIATAVATIVLAGCGGGGSDDPPEVKSKADFVAAADKICRDRDERSVELAKDSNGGSAAVLTGKLADIYADTISRLRALDLPPGADRAGAQKYVKSVSDMTKPVQRMKASAAKLEDARDVGSLKNAAAKLQLDVNTVQAIGDLSDQNARTYGFKICGKQQSANPIA
jgi:hypothetical protein